MDILVFYGTFEENGSKVYRAATVKSPYFCFESNSPEKLGEIVDGFIEVYSKFKNEKVEIISWKKPF